jgi:hypothetical protein
MSMTFQLLLAHNYTPQIKLTFLVKIDILLILDNPLTYHLCYTLELEAYQT